MPEVLFLSTNAAVAAVVEEDEAASRVSAMLYVIVLSCVRGLSCVQAMRL